MDYIFSEGEGKTTKFIGGNSAIALFSVALDKNLVVHDYKQQEIIEFPIGNPPAHDSTRLIKDIYAFETLLTNLSNHFTEEGIKGVINNLTMLWRKDSRLTKEIIETKELLKLVFELAEFIRDENLVLMHKEIFRTLQKRQYPGVWSLIRGDPRYQLILINEGLSYIMENDEKLPCVAIKTLEFAYAIEDAILQDPNQLKSKEIFQIMSKFLIILDKYDLIYISAPSIFLFDNRVLEFEQQEKAIELLFTQFETKGNIGVLREGGYVRIILKLLFLLMKFDDSQEQNYISLLKYFLFREKATRIVIEFQAGIEFPKENSDKKGGKHYNIFDLLLKKDSDKIKQHNSIEEYYLKKIINKEISLLDSRPIGKAAKEFPKNKCIFSLGPLLVVQIFTQIFQLLHFQILNISSYIEQDSPNILLAKLENFNTEGMAVSNQFRQLIQLIEEISKYEKGNVLATLLKKEFLQQVEKSKQLISSHLPMAKVIQLGVVYSVLDTVVLDPSTSKLKLIKIKEKEEERKVSIDPEEELETFMKSWELFIEILLNIIKMSTASSLSCEQMIGILIKPEFIQIIQPYLQMFTTHTLSHLDDMIAYRIAGRNKILTRQFRNEKDSPSRAIQKSSELEEKIREKFCYVGIPKEKMEQDELRKDFDVLANSIYKRMQREQQSEINAWSSKGNKQYLHDLCLFVNSQYKKVLYKCPLFKKVDKMNKCIENSSKEFVTLCESRDELGRALRTKQMKRIEESNLLGCNFGYLKHFTLKKFLLYNVVSVEEKSKLLKRGFFSRDFLFTLQKKLYSQTRRIMKEETKISEPLRDASKSTACTPTESDLGSDSEDMNSPYRQGFLPSDEYLPKCMHIKVIIISQESL